MVRVKLLPSSIVFVRARARRVRRWLVVVVLVTIVSGIPATIDLINTARAAVVERQISPLQAQFDTTQTGLKNAVTHSRDLAAWIAQADALRTKRSWSGLFLAMTQRMPDEIWLLAVETTSPRRGSTRARVPLPGKSAPGSGAAGTTAVTLDGPTGVAITGYALGHDWLYEFMTRLKTAGIFANVTMVQAGKEPVKQGEAIRFELECTW